eukprot:gene14132-17178_t
MEESCILVVSECTESESKETLVTGDRQHLQEQHQYGNTDARDLPLARASRYIHTPAKVAIRYKSITTWAVSGLDINSRPNAMSDCSAISIVINVYRAKANSPARAIQGLRMFSSLETTVREAAH